MSIQKIRTFYQNSKKIVGKDHMAQKTNLYIRQSSKTAEEGTPT